MDCETQPFITLTRMIIDNYSIFYLLSSYESIEEQQLSSDLYLLDSIRTRVSNLKKYYNTTNHVFDEKIISDAKKSSINLTGLSKAILSSKEPKLIKLLDIFDMCCMNKYTIK